MSSRHIVCLSETVNKKSRESLQNLNIIMVYTWAFLGSTLYFRALVCMCMYVCISRSKNSEARSFLSNYIYIIQKNISTSCWAPKYSVITREEIELRIA